MVGLEAFKCNKPIHWPTKENVLGFELVYCQATNEHTYHIDYNHFPFCTEEDRIFFNNQYELIRWKWHEWYPA